MTPRRWLDAVPLLSIPLLGLLLVACDGRPQVESGAQYGGSQTSADHDPQAGETVPAEEGGAEAGAAAMGAEDGDAAAAGGGLHGPDWETEVALASGRASIACEQDYATAGNGSPLASLEREDLEAAIAPCVEGGAVRVHYRGKIASDFTSLIQRVVAVADELGIGNRVLDIDSSGGRIEDGIRAGDAIAESGWTVWVREDAV